MTDERRKPQHDEEEEHPRIHEVRQGAAQDPRPDEPVIDPETEPEEDE